MLTGLATATFPDGSMPEVIDVVRVAANLFSAGQETTVRLLGTALQTIGERSDIQERLRADHALIPGFVEECLRFESPVKGDFRLSRTAVTVGGVEIPAGSTVMVLNGAAGTRPAPLRPAQRVPHGPEQRQGAPCVRPGAPRLSGWAVGPGGDPYQHRAAAGTDGRHPHLGVGPRAGRCTPLRLRPDLYLAWADAPRTEFTPRG